MSYLNDVFRQTADNGYFDFARCQRPDGTIYGSPSGKCKKGKLIGDKDEVPAKRQRANKGMRLTEKIKAMSAADLKKIAKDPRLTERQRGKLEKLIRAKEGSNKPAEKKTVSAAADKGRKTRDLAADVRPATLLNQFSIQENHILILKIISWPRLRNYHMLNLFQNLLMLLLQI